MQLAKGVIRHQLRQDLPRARQMRVDRAIRLGRIVAVGPIRDTLILIDMVDPPRWRLTRKLSAERRT